MWSEKSVGELNGQTGPNKFLLFNNLKVSFLFFTKFFLFQKKISFVPDRPNRCGPKNPWANWTVKPVRTNFCYLTISKFFFCLKNSWANWMVKPVRINFCYSTISKFLFFVWSEKSVGNWTVKPVRKNFYYLTISKFLLFFFFKKNIFFPDRPNRYGPKNPWAIKRSSRSENFFVI